MKGARPRVECRRPEVTREIRFDWATGAVGLPHDRRRRSRARGSTCFSTGDDLSRPDTTGYTFANDIQVSWRRVYPTVTSWKVAPWLSYPTSPTST
jgi:hypothetical protein